MVQIFERGPSRGALQSQLLGQGIGGAAGAYGSQQVRKGQLSEAFEQAKTAQQEGGNYLDIMGKLAPYMMSIPGGAELLSTITPIISQGVENDVISKELNKNAEQVKSLEQQKVDGETPIGVEEEKAKMVTVPGTQGMKISEEPQAKPGEKFKGKNVPKSKETLFPQRTIEPNLQKPMGPQEKNQFALNVMKESRRLGKNIPYQEALNLAEQQNQSILQFNNQILQEQQMKKQAMEQMGAQIVTRAANAGLIEPGNPEDVTVLEKFAYESRDAENAAQQWEYVRTEKNRFDTARTSIRTAGDLSGPVGNLIKKGLGTYKDIGEIQKTVQKPLEFYKEHGLIPEAREEISTSLGLGPEMTEETIFPFTGPQKKQIESFPTSPKELSTFQKIRTQAGEIGKLEHQFPGEEYRLPESERQDFKEELAKILTNPDNEDINLISLRGRLNQEKKYAWQDISQSLNELIQEGRFTPNYIQEQQIPVINQAPLPGLSQQFQYLYKGKK